MSSSLKAHRHDPPRVLPALVCLLALCAWLLAVFALRAHLVDAEFSPFVRCDACFFWPSLAHDSLLFAVALALMGMALCWRRLSLRLLPLLALAMLMLAVAADVLVFRSLSQRLLWSDVLKFFGDVGTVSDIGAQSLQGGARIVAVVLASGGVLAWCASLRHLGNARPLGWAALGGALLLALGGGYAQRFDPEYVNADLSFQNIAEVNLAQSIDAPYSPAFIAAMQAVPPLPQTCARGQQRRPDIVLVMVESLSAYHSKLYGGSMDAVPRLDALAASGRWFADFHANGFTTDGGMIGLLTGLAPVPLIGRYASMDAFAGYADRRHSLPALLAAQGYQSHFFTTGDLGFVDKRRWLAEIGFERAEGAEAPYYRDKARGIFNAARDGLLFERFAQWYEQERDRQRPLFATLLTVTTHPPFVDPESGLADEQGVFREVDAAIAAMHARLAASGFFEHGVLLVTGDHRAMTPLQSSEYQRHGEEAFSRVPMYAWGPGYLGEGRVDGAFQHSDLLPSVRQLTDDEDCRRSGQGLLLSTPPQPADFVLHARGMPRDRIDVYGAGFQSSLVLAGDDSHWLGDKPSQWQSIEAQVHLQRAARDGGAANLIDTLIRMRRAAP